MRSKHDADWLIVLWSLRQELDAAVDVYSKAVKIDENDIEARLALGEAQLKTGQLFSAATQFRYRLVGCNTARVVGRLLLHLLILNPLHCLCGVCRTICEQNPRHERAIELLAEAVERQGYASDAAAIRRGLQTVPSETKLGELPTGGSSHVRRDSDAASEISVATVSSTATSKSRRFNKLFGK